MASSSCDCYSEIFVAVAQRTAINSRAGDETGVAVPDHPTLQRRDHVLCAFTLSVCRDCKHPLKARVRCHFILLPFHSRVQSEVPKVHIFELK